MDSAHQPAADRLRECVDCSGQLGPKNKTGYCRRCAVVRFNKDPARRAKLSSTLKRKYQVDPEYRAAMRDRLRALAVNPKVQAIKSRSMKDNRIWEHARHLMHAGSPARQLAGKRIRETLLGWCPPERRDDYRHLVKMKHVSAADARAMILEEHERDMAAFRRKCMEAAA